MGSYYRMISRRTRTVAGITVAFSNFHGKAPGLFSDSNRAWNTFCTKARTNADLMKAAGIEHVVMAQTITDMAEMAEEGVPVARWNGQTKMHDGFWDNNIIGHFRKERNRWVYHAITAPLEAEEEEWTPDNADYCDVGSRHHY